MQLFLVFALRFLVTRGQGYAIGESRRRSIVVALLVVVVVAVTTTRHGQVFSIRANGFVRPSNGPLHDVITANNGCTKVDKAHDTLSPFGQGYSHALMDGLFESFVALMESKEPTVVVVVDWHCWSHNVLCVRRVCVCV